MAMASLDAALAPFNAAGVAGEHGRRAALWLFPFFIRKYQKKKSCKPLIIVPRVGLNYIHLVPIKVIVVSRPQVPRDKGACEKRKWA